jgi:hypothetical protein
MAMRGSLNVNDRDLLIVLDGEDACTFRAKLPAALR